MEQKIRVPAHLIYVGRRLLNKNKLAYYYIHEETKERISFKKKLHGFETVGTRIATEWNQENTYHGPYKLVERWTVEEDIIDWSIKDKAAYEELQLRNAEPKDTYIESKLNEIIKHIKSSNISRQERLSIALWVFRKLQ